MAVAEPSDSPIGGDSGRASSGEPPEESTTKSDRLVWVRGFARGLVPPEIWSTDRPSLAKQYTYAREGAWGPRSGWPRRAAWVCFWAVSFPTSVAAYYLEWVGERPSRWVTAMVLVGLAYQIPYVPEAVSVLVRVPAWPITALWSLLNN